MKALCILPGERPAVAGLARRVPLALVPLLGRTVVEHVLTHLAEAGAKEVVLLAVDRPAEIRDRVGRGEAWGMPVQVIPEARELTVAEARARHGDGGPWLPAPFDVFRLEELPQLPGRPLWSGHREFLAAVLEALPRFAAGRVGMRELSPGVWIGLRTRVAPGARLHAPCWVGAHAWVGTGATVGPGAVVEDGSCVDDGAEVSDSIVGPRTYVGSMTSVKGSFAWGGLLLNLDTGSLVEVPDRFLLSDLGTGAGAKASSLPGRLAALLVLVLTSPLLVLGAVRRRGGGPLLVRREAVRAGHSAQQPLPLLRYRELAGFEGLARRWPQLWNVVRGEFAWAGNRPLSPAQAAALETDYERLWLSGPPGLFSLADAMGCRDPFGDEARAHASFFAVDPRPGRSRRVLAGVGRRAFPGAQAPGS